MEHVVNAHGGVLGSCPFASITLDEASPRLPNTFSSRSSRPFKVSWIASSIALIIQLPPDATDSKVAPRAFLVMCRHVHDPFGGFLLPAWHREHQRKFLTLCRVRVCQENG